MSSQPLFLHAWVLCASLALAAFAAPAHAQTQNDARARDLYLQGDRAYNEGRYEEAVQDFLASYQLSGRPLLLYNLANAYERLGRYQEALDALRQYQPHAPIQELGQVRARITSLEQRVAQLSAESSQEEQQPAPQSTAPAYDEGLLFSGIAVGGVGVALAVTGIVMGVLALDARAEAQSGCASATGGTTVCDETVRGALDRDTTFALLADIGIGVGSAAVVAGVVLAILGATSSSGASAESARVVPYAAPRARGGELGVVVTF